MFGVYVLRCIFVMQHILKAIQDFVDTCKYCLFSFSSAIWASVASKKVKAITLWCRPLLHASSPQVVAFKATSSRFTLGKTRLHGQSAISSPLSTTIERGAE